MDLKGGYRRIVLVLAIPVGLLVGMAAGANLVVEKTHTSDGLAVGVLYVIGGLVVLPCVAVVYTWCLLWFGGLGISRLIVWVVHGFKGNPHAETEEKRSVPQTVSPLRITCAVVMGLLLIVGVCICVTRPTSKRPVGQPPKPSAVPCVPLCEIPIKDVDAYDLSLDISGTVSGFVKNGSRDMLKEVDTHVVIRNLRKDIIFQGYVTLRCEVPPGEARPFSYHAVPPQSIPCKYNPNGREKWILEGSFEVDKVAARGRHLGPKVDSQSDANVFDEALYGSGKPKDQRIEVPEGFILEK